MKKLEILTVLFSLILFISCSSNSVDDDPDTDPPNNNDVTYTANVKPIIDGKCLTCHTDPLANGAPMPLLTYENVREAVMNRGLISRVSDGSMPAVGSALTNAQVQAIKDWEAGGFIE